MNPCVDFLFSKPDKWQKELQELREIVLACELVEELKWGQACYTFQEKNIVLIHGFKEYCALLFFKGALMKDPQQILIQQTKNVQAGRQIRFTSLREIEKLKSTLKKYIYNAVAVEEAGLKVILKKTEAYKIPEELKTIFKKDIAFKNAFDALTPGRQRGYLLFFAQAKQPKTRMDRIIKHKKNILDGKGLQDDYLSGRKEK